MGRRQRDDMLALARRLGDDNGLALALYCQADIPWAERDFARAARLFQEAAAAASGRGSGRARVPGLVAQAAGAPGGAP